MEFSRVSPPDTSDITSNTKFTAHFNCPSAQCQYTRKTRRQETKSWASPALPTIFKNPGTQYRSGIDFHFDWGACTSANTNLQCFAPPAVFDANAGVLHIKESLLYGCQCGILARLVRLTVAFYGRCNWLSVFCGLSRSFP
jgi:hypothetical protein